MNDPTQPLQQLAADLVKPVDVSFLFGIFTLLFGVAISFLYPTPNKFQLSIITIVIGLGSAGIANRITGFLEISSKPARAGGPLAVFIFVCYFIWHANTGSTVP